MTIPTQYEIDKALVLMAIKSALSDFGRGTRNRIIKKLNGQNFTNSDWFANPEYIKNLLKEEFGSSYTTIIHSMQIWLGDSSSNTPISNFLLAILKENSASAKDGEHLIKSSILDAIEKALLKMGSPELKKVESQLLSDFNYTFEDCVSNPIPLKKILCELFGYCYEDIYQSMTYTLNDIKTDENIKTFLKLMKG